jgi:predicted deacylase
MSLPTPALAELAALERVIELGAGHLQSRVVCEVPVDPSDPAGARLPVHAITLGNDAPHVPAAAFIGGVHGLERIGAEVVIAYLQSLVMRLRWDSTLHRQLESVRLVFVPIVNPAGMLRGTRANAAGVDLMRNAPLDADDRVPWMVGGQRTSSGLPWYRGAAGDPLQPEARALCDLVREELLPRPFSISIDCHSGFGTRDRLWFPYAHTRAPIRHLAEMHALQDIFGRAHPLHRYIVEPQSRQYLAHGDLWDWLHLEAGARQGGGPVFLPLTLEMGSWIWVKKNPRQLFSRHGIFNPLIRHRQERTLRVHVGLLDFISRAATGWRLWVPEGDERVRHHEEALQRWY